MYQRLRLLKSISLYPLDTASEWVDPLPGIFHTPPEKLRPADSPDGVWRILAAVSKESQMRPCNALGINELRSISSSSSYVAIIQ
jgi:hypothetical protein